MGYSLKVRREKPRRFFYFHVRRTNGSNGIPLKNPLSTFPGSTNTETPRELVFSLTCVCPSVWFFVCLSVCLSVYLSVCLSVCLSICLSACRLSVRLSICLTDCLFVYLSISLSVCLSVRKSLSMDVTNKLTDLNESVCCNEPRIENLLYHVQSDQYFRKFWERWFLKFLKPHNISSTLKDIEKQSRPCRCKNF